MDITYNRTVAKGLLKILKPEYPKQPCSRIDFVNTAEDILARIFPKALTDVLEHYLKLTDNS